MAVTVRARILGIAEIRRDLEAVELGLGRELSAALKEGAELALPRARELTPEGPGPNGPGENALPHIAETLEATTVGGTAGAIATSHPGGPVNEYGGHIQLNRGRERGELRIDFRPHAMAHQAGEEKLPEIEAL